MAKDILEQVGKTSIRLMLQEPFWGHFLSGILKKVVQAGPPFSWELTKGSVPHLQLCVKAETWQLLELQPGLREGHLKHELLHLIFRHPLQAPKYGYPHLYDIACDLVVNQYLLPEQCPPGAILLDQFEPLQLNSFQGVDYYYQALVNYWNEHISDRPDLTLFSFIQNLKENLASPLYRHKSWWTTLFQLNQSQREIIDAGLDQLLLSTLTRIGEKATSHWPESLKFYLEQKRTQGRPSKDWRRILRLFVGSHHRTKLKNTIRRPSKRYGTPPGIRIQNRQKLLIALDTSGSISEETFLDFFQEIQHIWRLGIEILLVECDTQIRRSYLYKGQIPTYVSGRGGSSFDPPIQLANEEYQPDAIIYFTDGMAPSLQIKSRYPVLWVLPEKMGGHWQQRQGRRIYIKTDNQPPGFRILS